MSAASKLLIATILSMLLLSTFGIRVHAFTNGQSASLVVGQPDFTSFHAAISQSGLSAPIQVNFDTSGNMWVAEVMSNRIVEFKPPFSNGMNASLVIGQPDFTTSGEAITQSDFSHPYGSSFPVLGFGFDSLGNLWVADISNNRVLEFKPPFANGMSASLVIGQKNFTTAIVGGSSNGLTRPGMAVFDPSGDLWVLDGGNHRILEFKPPFSSGMSASLVIGQANFETTSDQRSLTQSGIAGVDGSDLIIDSSGNIWVGDAGNNRVLEFKPPFSNGMNASLVIGQQSYTTSTHSTTQNGLFLIQTQASSGVALDPAGNLWVADSLNNRVLEFRPPFSNGMSASLVIGQTDFTTRAESTTQNELNRPFRPAFDSSGNLWVPDILNNRVLEFSSSGSSSVTSTLSPTAQSTTSITTSIQSSQSSVTSITATTTSTTTTQSSQTSITASTSTTQGLGQLQYVASGAAIVVVAAGLIAVFLLRSRRKGRAA